MNHKPRISNARPKHRSITRTFIAAISLGALIAAAQTAPAFAGSNHWSQGYGQAALQPNSSSGGFGDWGCIGGFDSRQLLGGVLGAALGGLLGAQIGNGTGQLAAAATGTLLGAFLGGSIAGQMSGQDRECVAESLETAPVGQTVSWHNPETNRDYSVTPTRTVRHQGRYCREYQTTITVGGHIEDGYGTACRQPDGSWEIVS